MGKMKTTEEYKKEVFEIVGNEYSVISKYMMNKTKIKMKHIECSQEFEVTPNNFLSKNSRCPFCFGTTTHIGVNDINTTHPEVAAMLLTSEDKYKYRAGSGVKLDWICPQCGERVKNKTPSKVSTYGLMCPHCSDGISYPNKFALSLFKQLYDVLDYYEREYSPEWASRYSYDNFFIYKGAKYIVEMDGGIGHGYRGDISGTRPSGFLLNNDIIKEKLAVENNIKIIRIPALISEKLYLKNEILNSELNEILNLKYIDWNRCELDSLTSLKIKTCDLWNNKFKDTLLISKELNISQNTVERYLNQCHDIGLCNYDKSISYEIAKIKRSYISYHKNGIPFICNETNNYFGSASILANKSEELYGVKIHLTNIFNTLKGGQKNTRGFTFKYITREEFNNHKLSSPSLTFGDLFILEEEIPNLPSPQAS